jgi:hypothetical protein
MDLSKIETDFRKEIVREGTVYLDGQLRVATSADSRAAGLAGIFTAATTALIAGVVVALFNSPTHDTPSLTPLIFAGIAAAILLFSAALLCILAIQPVGFWLPGLAPENWQEDVLVGRKLEECLSDRAQHIQEQIAENLTTIQRNARLFKWGSRLGISAPFAGFLIWLLAFFACRGV